MRALTGFVVFCCCLIGGFAPELAAQELRGDIVGVASDSTGGVLPGVTVTAAGPALVQPRTVVTATNGRYRFVSLPPGVYSVTFELASFQTVRHEGIGLTLRRTLTVNATLAPGGVTEEVTVVAEAPVVDVKSTSTGTSFDRETLATVPTARDVWSAMTLAPGFEMQGVDVGGSHVGSQTRFSAYGIAVGHVTYIEGVRSNNSQTSNSAYFDFGSYEEFELGSSGNMGENSGPGALLNFTVKSGGNDFHGSTHFSFQNDGMRSDNVPSALAESGGVDGDGFGAPRGGFGEGSSITRMHDVNADLGGPIRRGKAWFYTSVREHNIQRNIVGLPGQEAQTRLRNVSTKFNYALNARNTLIGYYAWREKFDPQRGVSAVVPPESAQYQIGRMHIGKIEWTSVLSDRMFLDVQVGLHHATNLRTNPANKSESVEGIDPGRQELTSGQLTGPNPLQRNTTDHRPQFSGSLSWSPGDHAFKVGVDVNKFTGGLRRFNAGDAYYYDEEGIPVEVDVFNTPIDVENHNRNFGFFAQDSWNVSPRVTVNLGVRYDNYVLGWPDETNTPNRTGFFPVDSVSAETLVTWNQFAPRGGVAWDVSGDGSTVLKVFAGRFYLDPIDNLTEDANPLGYSSQRWEFADLNGNRVLDGASELGRLLDTEGGAGGQVTDPDLKQPYGEELSAHFEREIGLSTSLRVSWVYKNLRRQIAIVDLNRAVAYTVPFTFVDVGPDNEAGTADDQTLNIFDREDGVSSNNVLTNPGPDAGTPAHDADHHTLELAVHRRFRDRWMLLASGGHTWTNQFYDESSRTGPQDPVHVRSVFEWRPNRRRYSPESTTTSTYKVVGRYETPWWGLGASTTYRFHSGYPWARRITPNLPEAGRENMPAEPVASNRGPSLSIWDLRLDKDFTVGASGTTLSVLLDVSNVLNAGTVTNFRTTSGSRFKEVIAILPSRSLRVGVDLRF